MSSSLIDLFFLEGPLNCRDFLTPFLRPLHLRNIEDTIYLRRFIVPTCVRPFFQLPRCSKNHKDTHILRPFCPPYSHPLLFHVSQHYRPNLVPFRPSVDTQNSDDTTYGTHFFDPFLFVRTTFRVHDSRFDALLMPKIVKTRHIERVLLRPSRPFCSLLKRKAAGPFCAILPSLQLLERQRHYISWPFCWPFSASLRARPALSMVWKMG